jgi:hypothetical protein
MRRLCLVALCWFLGSATVLAQSAPVLQWKHDGVNVTRFEIVVDGGAPTNVGVPTPAGITYQAALPSTVVGPAAQKGQHAVIVRACNVTGCTASAVLIVVTL